MRPHILVATDGKHGARGALRATKKLAEAWKAKVTVLAVLESSEIYSGIAPHELPTLPERFVPTGAEALRMRVRAQLIDTGADALGWDFVVEMGAVAPAIARAAADREATIILVGLRRPGAVERWLSRETVLRVVHLAHVPVLALGEVVEDLPRRIVLGVDFSDFSRRAAQEAARILVGGGELHPAHVAWVAAWEGDRVGREEWTEWEKTYRAGVEQRMEEFVSEIQRPAGVTVTPHILAGEPVRELLSLAERIDADLIAAGSHGAGFFGRIVIGSVSSKLVHRGERSLLLVPPIEIPAELEAVTATEMPAEAQVRPTAATVPPPPA